MPCTLVKWLFTSTANLEWTNRELVRRLFTCAHGILINHWIKEPCIKPGTAINYTFNRHAQQANNLHQIGKCKVMICNKKTEGEKRNRKGEEEGRRETRRKREKLKETQKYNFCLMIMVTKDTLWYVKIYTLAQATSWLVARAHCVAAPITYTSLYLSFFSKN